MSLLTNASVIGVGAGGTTLASWTAAGSLIGTITLSEAVNAKKGAVAASTTDNRIYALTGTTNVRIYNENGVLQTTIAVADTVRSLYVPEAGKLWVAHNHSANGRVDEYNTSGVFQSTISNLTYIGGGYIEAGYGMYRYSGNVYYLALRGTGFTVNSGVFSDVIATAVDSTQVLPLLEDPSAQPRRFGMASTGDFWVTEANVAGGVWQKIDRYNSSGVLQQSVSILSGVSELGGLAVDDGGGAVYAGDVTGGIIYRLETSLGSLTSFSAVVNSSNCCSALCSPFGAAALALEIACPTNDTGTVGQAYSGQINATGDSPPYVFALVSGTLPPGLTLNTATGVISGIPTTAGTFTFTISVT